MINKKYTVCTRCFTYNQAPYIKDALRGFCSQKTSFPVVYVIVDDASTDGEPEVIKRFVYEFFDVNNNEVFRQEESENYRLLFAQHKNNENCFFAVVFLKENHYRLNKPKKPYISEWLDASKYKAICEGDDYWIDPLKLQKQVDILEGDSSIGLVHTNCHYHYQDSGKVVFDANNELGDVYNSTSRQEIINAILYGQYRIRTASVLYRTEVAVEALAQQDKRMYNGHFKMGDIQFWIGIIQLSNVHYMHESTVVYRIISGSVSRPKSYYETIRFNLSSKELRLFYNKEYGYVMDDIDRIRDEYKQLLRSYNEYDPSYKGIVDVGNLYQSNWTHFLFKIWNMCKHVKFAVVNMFK